MTSNLKILIADDNRDHVQLMGEIIKQELGAEIDSATTGEECLKKVDKNSYDLLLLDYLFPKISGLDILKTITEKQCDLPVIMVTGHGNEKIAVEAMRAGAIDYIVKSEDGFGALPSAAKKAIEKSQLKNRLRESEEKFKNLFESANDAIIYLDRSGRILEVNKKAVEMFGRSKQEVLGKHFTRLGIFSPRDMLTLMGNFSNILAGKETSLNVCIKNKKGQEIALECSASLMKTDDKVTGVMVVARDITERKQAEETQKRLVAIIEATPDFVGFADAKDKHIIYVNKAGRKMCGIGNDEDVTKLKISDVHPEWTNKMFAEEILPAAVRDGVWTGECAFLNIRDRHEMPVSMVLSSHKASNGEVEVFSTISRDITERKKAEEALKESEEKYRSLFKNMLNGYAFCKILVDKENKPVDFIYIDVNDAFEKLTGLRKEDVIGKRVTEAIPSIKDLNPEIIPIYGEVASTGKPATLEVFFKSLDIWLTISVYSPHKDYFVAIFDNITERKKMEETLKASESKYKTLLENIPQKIFFKDKNSVYISCNENYAGDLKLKPHEIVGKTDYDFYPKELAEKYRADDKRVMQTGETEDLEEDYIQDGQKIFVHTVKTPVKDEKGNIIGVLGIFWDITERKKLQQQLIQTEKLVAVGTLAYGIAHEFNNILAGMMANAELGLITGDSQQVKECFETIVENSQRASSITNNLLAFARQKETRKELVDITEPLKSVLSIIHRELEKNNIKIIENFKPIPKIFCDAGQFSEVFLNMLTNARDAMTPDGGTLTVQVEPDKDNIRIIFKDTGCGIPEEIKGRIFEAFVTTKGALGKSNIPGTGLGLFLIYGIIDGYQGRIEVESEVGKGTQFTILIPVSKNLPREPLLDTLIEAPKDIEKKLRILLVDDEKAISLSLQKFLESRGHKVTISLKAKEGLELFKKDKFDLVLSDITIPDMDGIELIKKIKQEDTDAKIIAITGHILKEKGEKAKEAGADEVLIKPFKNEVLCTAISKVITG